MLTIYLADLTHTTITLSNDTMPLGIGYVGAYLKNRIPEVKVRLFKYPEDMLRACESSPPDIAAFSNYPWNHNLGLSFMRYLKRRKRRVVTVMGGPNIPHRHDARRRFMLRCSGTLDFYAAGEGEKSFYRLVDSALRHDLDTGRMGEEGVEGVLALRASGPGAEPDLAEGAVIERQKELREFPSPYLSGMLDSFFDGKLIPMIETHRGCPYRCTYCHEGHLLYSRVARHDQSRIVEELDYIAGHVGEGVGNLIIADPNFGMFTRDVDLAGEIAAIRSREGYPRAIVASTAKDKKENIVKIVRTLEGVSFPVWMSVQSMTPSVLERIKRKNLRVERMVEIQKELEANDIDSKSELILSLPGESYGTHLESLLELMRLKMRYILCYQLMLVQGSELADDEATKEEFRFETRHRIVPRSFTSLREAGPSVETEEIVVATRDFGIEDYMRARTLHLAISIFYNGGGFKGFFRIVEEEGLDLRAFVEALLEGFRSDLALSGLVRGFEKETEGELFASREEIEAFCADEDNFAQLVRGESGANLLQKYTALAFMGESGALVGVISRAARQLGFRDPESAAKLDNVRRYYEKAFGIYLDEGRVETDDGEEFDYDMPRWLSSAGRLEDFRVPGGVGVVFYTPQEQFMEVENYFERYGRSAQAFGKIMTRVWIQELQRKVRYET